MWLLITIIMCTTSIKAEAKTAMEYIEMANLEAMKIQNAKGNVKLFESDIIIRYPEKISKLPFKQRAATKFQSRLWPGAVIPFVFSQAILNSQAKEVIKDAMMDWETNTCIRFVERTNEKDYVEFSVNLLGCNSDVGKHGGRQVISLGRGCLHRSVVIHEIGHVIGFWHEQNRPDRDDYVHIFTDNILDDFKGAFLKFSKYRIDSLRVEYDYHSIMHYTMKAFSKNGLYTIVPKKKGVLTLGNERLSPLDIKQTNLLYKCDRINRGWTKWSRWTNCDKTCGGGTQERTRVCTSLKDGKQQCPGSKIEKRVCSLQKCPDWPTFPNDFSFEYLRIDRGMEADCVLIYERADYQEWNSYSFCNRGKRGIQMRWSDQGPLAGMKCTQIIEPEENQENRWYDNYLCLTPSAPYNFTWSYEGKKENMACIQWFAKGGRDGWNNNFLCAEPLGGFVDMTEHKPVNGKWSSWTAWSVCDRECGVGRQRRMRFCNNPRPQYGGKVCKGEVYKYKKCSNRPCGPLSCGGVLKGTKGEFTSPNYPSNYPSDTNCTWTIQGNQKKKILLTITSFDLEKLFDGPCKFDYLEVRDKSYNGNLKGKYCGNKVPMPILSDSNSLWVSLVTDGQDNRAGFRASWKLLESVPEVTSNGRVPTQQ